MKWVLQCTANFRAMLHYIIQYLERCRVIKKISTHLLQGKTQIPQHFSMPDRFFSASRMSALIWSIPSSILSNCSVHTHHRQFKKWPFKSTRYMCIIFPNTNNFAVNLIVNMFFNCKFSTLSTITRAKCKTLFIKIAEYISYQLGSCKLSTTSSKASLYYWYLSNI